MIRLRFTSPNLETIDIGPFPSVRLGRDSMAAAFGRSGQALYAHDGHSDLMVATAHEGGWTVLPQPYSLDGEDGAGWFRCDVEIIETSDASVDDLRRAIRGETAETLRGAW